MNRQIQKFFLWVYRKLEQTGILENKHFREMFYFFYNLYKLIFEVGPVQQLQPFAKPGTVVIDVGANVGFFTIRFAKWIVKSGGKVIALEPEKVNFQRLTKVLADKEYTSEMVEALPYAVAEKNGVMHLAINPYHPGDHRLDENGIPVDVVTIDGLLEARNWPTVSLIKIDVQGAELRVIQGAITCLKKFKPSLFIEMDEKNLKKSGGSAYELIETVCKLGYKPFKLNKSGNPTELSQEAALEIVRSNEYVDLLFI